MKFKKSGLMLIVVALIYLIGSYETSVVYAMEAEQSISTLENHYEVSPDWDEISSISPYISADGTTLYSEVYIYAKSTIDSISGTMYLEKYSFGRWTSVTSWNIKGIGNAFLSKSYNGSSGIKYRTRVVVTVNGEKAEAISGSLGI